MNIKHFTVIKGCAIVLAGSLLASMASARDFGHRTDLHNRSLFQGLAKTDVPLLSRETGPGRTAILGKVYDRLRKAGLIASGITEEVADDEKQALGGSGWRLAAHDDGTRVRFRNRAAVETNRARGRVFKVEQRMSNEDLEARGREFVKNNLSDLVVLGDKEAMVALFTEHEIDHDQKSTGEVLPDSLIASTVVFGRTVDGVDIVGPGSKVAVMFSADGQTIGFDAEWPKYRRLARKQRVLAAATIRERASALGTMKAGADVVELDRFECGYVDLGAHRRRRQSAAPIQTGCAAHYWGRKGIGPNPAATAADGQGEVSSVVDFVPAGVTVEPDQGWAGAMQVCQDGDQCGASELGRALKSAQPASQPHP